MEVVLDLEATESSSTTEVVDLECDKNVVKSLCAVCYTEKPLDDFIQFSNCGHKFCVECVKFVFEASIMESRTNLQCLYCDKGVNQDEVQRIVALEYFEKYLYFSLRKFLITQQPDVCFCLAPNCPYACINSSSPEKEEERNHFVCGVEECQSEYCNRCKKEWHSDRVCEEVKGSGGISEELKQTMGTKNCPSCGVVIQKLSDGSCNQVVCSVCRTSFCWLCGKCVGEMHFMR